MDVACERDEDGDITYESDLQVKEWLVHHMDDLPFYNRCYNSSITTKQINDLYLIENGNDLALQIHTIHDITPLRILLMNPHAPADAIAELLNPNMEAIMCLDSQQKGPLENARDVNVDGLITMIAVLRNPRNSSIRVEVNLR